MRRPDTPVRESAECRCSSDARLTARSTMQKLAKHASHVVPHEPAHEAAHHGEASRDAGQAGAGQARVAAGSGGDAASRDAGQAPRPALPAATHHPVDLGAFRIADPEAFGRNVLRLMEEGTKALHGLLERAQKIAPRPATGAEWAEAGSLLSDITRPWVADPVRLIEAQGALFTSYMQLYSYTAARAMGATVTPVAVP